MNRKHVFAVLVGFVAIAVLAADASAMYHPTVGRWISRDPGPEGAAVPLRIGQRGLGGQYADGMNLFEYCAGAATSARDPYGLFRGGDWSMGYLSEKDIGVRVRRRSDHTWLSYPNRPLYEDLGSEMGYPGSYPMSDPNSSDQPSTWGAPLQSNGAMQAGPAAQKMCACVTVDDVYACFRAVRADPKWNPRNFDWEHHNCRDFVRDVLDRCCLRMPGQMWFDLDALLYKKGPDVGRGDSTIEDWNDKMKPKK